MRTLILFSLAIAFFLVGGESKLYAGTNPQWSAQKVRKVQPEKLTNQRQPAQVIKHSSLNDKNPELLNIEDESEDFRIIKKVVPFANYAILLASVTYFGSLFKEVKAKLPFCIHFSYTSSFKYILQRVLRI
jgi:hypothetical protein